MPAFRERLFPAPWVFIATALVIPAMIIVFLPIAAWLGVAIAAALYGTIVVALLATTPTIEVDADEFRAGQARLPRAVVGEVEPYRGDEASLERGRLLDARAWLLIRGWISPVVKVRLVDPDDPTPYWLVSTRRPEELVAALRD
ncbi:MAG: DUF3093 domain-containing protein [Micrococcales bacterium]|nr:DUF3093 domain-containing protein [Micrococcales bacterium]